MFYSRLGVETLWTAYTTNMSETFCKISENLISRMSKQGCNITVFF